MPQIEYSLKIGTKDWIFKDNGMELKIVIPSTQTDKFRFSVLEDGSVELVSLKFKLKVSRCLPSIPANNFLYRVWITNIVNWGGGGQVGSILKNGPTSEVVLSYQ